MTTFEVLAVAEDALGSNLVWITDQVDLKIRQKDPETLERLKQLNEAWHLIVKTLNAG